MRGRNIQQPINDRLPGINAEFVFSCAPAQRSLGMKAKTGLRCIALTLLALMPLTPAVASGDLFYFEASQPGFSFSLMLIGREDPGAVQVSWTGAPAPDVKRGARRYYLEFNRAKRQLYVRPRTRDGLPWFELDVSGDRGDLLFEGRRLQGGASWMIQ